MNDPEFTEKMMEDFLDNLLNDEERQDFLDRMKDDSAFANESRLQSRIDQALASRFCFADEPIDDNFFTSLRTGRTEPSQPILSRRNLTIAVATSLLLVVGLGGWQYFLADRSPYFASQNLVEIYEENIERGFKPYYECHDMQRFAGTFQHRFGIALMLSKMPEDRGMLGISYAGGVSRNTVAMLSLAKGQPVMVFIDRDQYHDPLAATPTPDSDLAVFVKRARGLIFYEVTPHDHPCMLDFLVIPDAQE